MTDRDLLASGSYARKQIFSSSRLVAWSHRRRFAEARRLLAPYAGGRLLDYGCGDGTLLALVADLFPRAAGADADPAQLRECVRRFEGRSDAIFLTDDALRSAAYDGAFDVVACTEVLEHCVAAERRRVLAELKRLVAPCGRVVISVPIETGPSLIVKQMGRALAARSGLAEYGERETYTARELLAMLFAGPDTSIPRPEYPAPYDPDGATPYHGHKGFNWRTLLREASEAFVIEARRASPLPLLGPFLNTQVWLVCAPRTSHRTQHLAPGTPHLMTADARESASPRAGSAGTRPTPGPAS